LYNCLSCVYNCDDQSCLHMYSDSSTLCHNQSPCGFQLFFSAISLYKL